MKTARARWTSLDLPIWIVFAVLLISGLAVQRSVERRTETFSDPQGTFKVPYPSGWLPVPGSSSLLDVQTPATGAPVPTRLIVTREARDADQTLQQVATDAILRRSRELPMYRVLWQRPVGIAGKEAAGIGYAFVADPHEVVLAAERVPVSVRGLHVIVLVQGAAYHIDFRAATSVYWRDRPVYGRILRQVQL